VEYVDEQLLPSLYAGADLFVFPSLYEGFGFTPLEAMQNETPVISSATGSLPEVLGDAAMIVKDMTVDAWVSAIQSLLPDTTQRQLYVQRGLRHVRQFTWAETAKKTWDVYRSLKPGT
jgi:glycosyltransferase involved in cell wall biosynthesis